MDAPIIHDHNTTLLCIAIVIFCHCLQVLRDWHLLAVTMVVTGTSVFLLLLETAIPQLRGKVAKEVDQENPSGMTVS